MLSKPLQVQRGDRRSGGTCPLVPGAGVGGALGPQKACGARRLVSATRRGAVGGSPGEMAKVEEPRP